MTNKTLPDLDLFNSPLLMSANLPTPTPPQLHFFLQYANASLVHCLLTPLPRIFFPQIII